MRIMEPLARKSPFSACKIEFSLGIVQKVKSMLCCQCTGHPSCLLLPSVYHDTVIGFSMVDSWCTSSSQVRGKPSAWWCYNLCSALQRHSSLSTHNDTHQCVKCISMWLVIVVRCTQQSSFEEKQLLSAGWSVAHALHSKPTWLNTSVDLVVRV